MVMAMVELQDCMTAMLLELERQIGDPLRLEIVLDMAETPVISSGFVNELIRVNLRMRMSGRRLLLINVQPTICEVFKLLRLDRTFDFEPIPICIENKHASSTIKQTSDPAQKTSNLFLRKFVSRLAPRSAH